MSAHIGIPTSKTGSLPGGPDIALLVLQHITPHHHHLLDSIGCDCTLQNLHEPNQTQPMRACLQFQQVALEHTILDSLETCEHHALSLSSTSPTVGLVCQCAIQLLKLLQAKSRIAMQEYKPKSLWQAWKRMAGRMNAAATYSSSICCSICSMSWPTKIVPCRASAGASVHWLCHLSSLSMSYHHLICSWHCWAHQPSPPLSHQMCCGLSAHAASLTLLYLVVSKQQNVLHIISIKYSQKNTIIQFPSEICALSMIWYSKYFYQSY